VTQLGLGLDGVLVVPAEARSRSNDRRGRAPLSGQLSLLDVMARLAADPGPRAARPASAPGTPVAPRLDPAGPLFAPTPLFAPALTSPALAPSALVPPALVPPALVPPSGASPRAEARPRRGPAPPTLRPVPDEPPPRRRRPAVREESFLETELGRRIASPVLVRVTDNTSTMISFRRRGRALYVRTHRMFAAAPPEVLDALALFVSRDEVSRQDARLLDEWIERHRHVLTEARSDALKVMPIGEVHDLAAIFARLNGAHFAGKIAASITWTRAAKGQRRTSIHMGTYEAELGLIRIHPALDQAWVPEYFVEFVVFHEMLHQVHGVAGHGEGRRAVHPPAFRADEKRFPRYAEARRWEKDNLRRLLRY
jgi:hypothetical protein